MLQNSSIAGMRICIVLRNPVDWRSIKTARALARYGAEVTILAFFYGVDISRFADEPFSVITAQPVEAPPSTFSFFVFRGISNRTLRKARTVLRFCRFGMFGTKLMAEKIVALKPDIICAVNPDVLKACTQAAEQLDAYVVYDAHEHWPDHKYDTKMRRTKRIHLQQVESDLDKNVDLAITVSDELASDYKAEYNLARKPAVIYNAPTDISAAVTPIHDPLRVVYAGNLVGDRGLLDLLMAVRACPDLCLAIYGSGDREGSLQSFIRKHGLANRVQIHAPVPVDNLIETLSDHDIGVLAYPCLSRHFDGALPNKFFEYLSAGLAIIAPKTKALSRVSAAHPREFALLLETPDAPSIAAALDKLSQDKEQLLQMKRAALDLAQQFAGDVQGQRLLLLYEEMLRTEPKALSAACGKH
ncbi:MAG: glycosyltransferase [Coriobacteriia bacterium]|nr:glycosyltransferase [Coriobacteriia bacterium]